MTVRRIELSGKAITTAFALSIVALGLAHVVFQSVRHHLGMPEFYGLVRLFDMGVEANIPTFFSSMQMLVVSLLLTAIGLVKRRSADRYARQWLWLAVMFFLLSLDEMSEVHEMTIRPIRELAPGLVTGLFYWAWVIPAGVLVVLVSIGFASFVFRYMPGYLRRAAVLGAIVFVAGAVGVEMPEARYAQINGIDNFTYALYVLLEETMEMSGILIFLSGLLRYAGSELADFSVRVVSPPWFASDAKPATEPVAAPLTVPLAASSSVSTAAAPVAAAASFSPAQRHAP
jgi:hypothetical protein